MKSCYAASKSGTCLILLLVILVCLSSVHAGIAPALRSPTSPRVSGPEGISKDAYKKHTRTDTKNSKHDHSAQEAQNHTSSVPNQNQSWVVLDLETQLLHTDVGGWQHKSKMKVAVAVTYSYPDCAFRQYTEEQIPALLHQLFNASLIIGFNLLNFDYDVLQPYSERSLHELPTLDISAVLYNAFEGRFRVSLDNLAGATLNASKSGDGKDAVSLYNQGKISELMEYCKKDVEITRDLYVFAKKKGYLLYKDFLKGVKQVKVAW